MECRVGNRRVKCLSRAVIGEGETEGGGVASGLLESPRSGGRGLGSLPPHNVHPGAGNTGSRAGGVGPGARRNQRRARDNSGDSRCDNGSLCRGGADRARGTSSGRGSRDVTSGTLAGPILASPMSTRPNRGVVSGGRGGMCRLTESQYIVSILQFINALR